tara:strand:+ start:3841 stop:4254 length:414 start_codon:yes stop_codon:yes gene_type:complete
MITWIKIKTVSQKLLLWAKKFWWLIIIGLLFACAGLIGALTRNGALLAAVMDLLESKRDAHDQEMETIAHIHNNEIAEKNARLEEHLRRRSELQEEFKKRGETLDKDKEAELKRLVDESYNDPEKLAKELAEAFGLK